MRSATEIIKGKYMFYDEDIYGKDVELNGEQVSFLINEARKEAIIECAKKAKVKELHNWNDSPTFTICVDKESILSLIKELK